MAANSLPPAANSLPLSIILGRSVSEGYIKQNDPEYTELLRSRRRITDDEEETTTPATATSNAPHTQRVPLSQSAAIYSHKIGLRSTTTRPYSDRPKRVGTINVLNSSRTSRRDPAAGTNGDTGARPVPVARGYGLTDFSSDESDYSSDLSDSDDGVVAAATTNGRSGATRYIPAANNPAHYVAHITGRMDPWEAKMQQIQNLGKDLQPEIADKIAKDVDNIARQQSNSTSTVGWIRDDDIIQKVKSLSLQSESVRDRRKKESDSRNQAMKQGIDACLAQIKDERETALRNLQEAARKVQEEKDRIAKEAEDKRTAEIAKKEEQEKKAAETAAAAAVAAAERAEKAKKAAAEKASLESAKSSTVFASESAKLERENYLKVLENIKSVVTPAIAGNINLKKACNATRRDIVSAIGRVTNRQDEIMRVAMEIDAMLQNTMRMGEVPYYWAMNVIAKKLVKQSETECLVRSAPAFPLAHVAVLLFTSHAQFLEVLMARFAKKCVYVTPVYVPKAPGDSAEQYMTKLAYKKKESGFESEAQYDARQCAIFTLYCAILQTKPPVGANVHAMDNGWRWMARILNMPPRPITPALIQVFLEVCGNEFMRTYRNQATKTLQLLMHKFIPLIPQQGVAGTVRLKTLLEQFLKTGNIPVAEGQRYDR
ncbi:hypothetical protein BGW39_001358 [Mortierella sp. 14UC]|nr:hypothetical protein BGW39_001358 [Mortierella sp. 14UC]